MIEATGIKQGRLIEEILEEFRQVGFSQRSLRETLQSYPEMLRLGVGSKLKEMLCWSREVGLSYKQLAGVIAAQPSVLKKDLSTEINPLVAQLREANAGSRTVGIDSACRILRGLS